MTLTASVAQHLQAHRAQGTQLVGRTCTLLREIARHGSAGVRLRDITTITGLTHATVHRILQSLVAEGFISQDPATRTYRLGGAIYELGLAAPNPFEAIVDLRPILEEFADRIGETVYLMMRRGDEVQCLARAAGASRLRAYVIEVGEIRPVGTSLAGICTLADVPDKEVDAMIARTSKAMERYDGATPEFVRRQLASARQNGFCISREVLSKMATGISAAVPNRKGPPFLGVSISAVSSRVPDARVPGLVTGLKAACEAMSRVI